MHHIIKTAVVYGAEVQNELRRRKYSIGQGNRPTNVRFLNKIRERNMLIYIFPYRILRQKRKSNLSCRLQADSGFTSETVFPAADPHFCSAASITYYFRTAYTLQEI